MRWEFRPCFENTLFPVARPRPFLLHGVKLLLNYDFMNLQAAHAHLAANHESTFSSGVLSMVPVLRCS